MEKSNELFSDRINELMEEQSYTSQVAADKIGVPVEQIQLYRNACVIPSGLVLEKLGDLFGVSIDYLMGRTTARMVCDPADVTYRKIARYEIFARMWNRLCRLLEMLKAELDRLDEALYKDVKRMNKEKQNE